MKAIQAEHYGCTDLSQVELEQTRGGINWWLIGTGIAGGLAAAGKQVWDYLKSWKISGQTGTTVTKAVENN